MLIILINTYKFCITKKTNQSQNNDDYLNYLDYSTLLIILVFQKD